MEKNLSPNYNLSYAIATKTKLTLMSLLFLLNLVIRIPSIPHEKGYDSFFIHYLANTISYYGEARWWINWMSIFGMYPYSYASSVPFSLSGISQLTGISMEKTILLFCIMLGMLSVLFSYLLASVFYDDFISKFLFSCLFSLSAGTLNLTTWEITTRAQFLVFFPFSFYILYRLLNNKKFALLFSFIFIFVLATHHYAYFLLIFSVAIFISFIAWQYGSKINFKRMVEYSNPNLVYLAILLILFSMPFLFPTKVGMINSGSRYEWIITLIKISVRNLGFVFLFSIGGFISLTGKKTKNFKEWSILICFIPGVIFFYNQTYGYLITYFLLMIAGSWGLINVINGYNINKKTIILLVSFFLIINSSFSCFFTHWHLGGYSEWYMRDETYVSGEWINHNLDPEKLAMCNGYESIRMFRSAGVRPIQFHDSIGNYINGLLPLNESSFQKNSPYSLSYYLDNPYILTREGNHDYVLSWLYEFPITDFRNVKFIQQYKIYYFFEDSQAYNTLSLSLPDNKNRIYDGGRMRLWVV